MSTVVSFDRENKQYKFFIFVATICRQLYVLQSVEFSTFRKIILSQTSFLFSSLSLYNIHFILSSLFLSYYKITYLIFIIVPIVLEMKEQNL